VNQQIPGISVFNLFFNNEVEKDLEKSGLPGENLVKLKKNVHSPEYIDSNQ